MKKIITQHGILILSIISILVLFLPLAKVAANIEVMGISGGSEVTTTGFSALKEGIFGYFLIIGPAVLIAMNYVKALGKYKGVLAIAVPAVCLIALILVIFDAKSAAGAASGGMASADIKLKVGIGAVLAALTYIGTIIVGAITYHDFSLEKLEKIDISKLKESGSDLLSSVQEKFSQMAQRSGDTTEHAEQESNSTQTPESTSDNRRTTIKRTTNLSRVDEILALIEKLSKMKDAGILSEEEFAEKKKQLLGEI